MPTINQELLPEDFENSETDYEMGKGSTLKNETLLKKNLKDLEGLWLQLEDHNLDEIDIEDSDLWQYWSPSTQNNNTFTNRYLKQRSSLISGDKGGSSILRKNEK